MRIGNGLAGNRSGWMGLFVFLGWALAAPAEGGVIEGFEDLSKLRPTGKVARVTGADAVTQGRSALELPPGAGVTVKIPAGALKQVGWLRIDTFEPQPVLACLELDLVGHVSRRGYVLPGRDILALPLSLAAGSRRGPWPAKPVDLRITNAGQQPVVVDNVRLAEPRPAPPGAVLLDFGPPGQVLWPGFEHAELEARNLAWSGEARIFSHHAGWPDPLLGDFAGKNPSYKVQETVTVRSEKGMGLAWFWVTHYSYMYSPPLEYVVRLNGRCLLRRRLGPSAMLSTEGLFSGRGEPWTPEWFQKTFVPRAVSRLECALKSGNNRLELANCQLAAVVIGPRARQQALRRYVARLDADLKRYHRQFVLARRETLRCEVVPTDQETKQGAMAFVPPRDEWFSRSYVPVPEDRSRPLKLLAAAGSGALGALAVVPCRQVRLLRGSAEPFRAVEAAGMAAESCTVYALAPAVVVRRAVAEFQPFFLARELRGVEARSVQWLALWLRVPRKARSGTYRGAVRVLLDQTTIKVPVELEVVRFVESAGPGARSFGVASTGDCFDAYRSLAVALPAPRRAQLSRLVLKRLAAFGVNATYLAGPVLTGRDHRPSMGRFTTPLRNGVFLGGEARSGKSLVTLGAALAGMRDIQLGTKRYREVLDALVKETVRAAGQYRLRNYALHYGGAFRASGLEQAGKVARIIRDAKGRASVLTSAAALKALAAEKRRELFQSLDSLLLVSGSGMLGMVDEFKRDAPNKAVLLWYSKPDVYAFGFYCWGVGADGAYAGGPFAPRSAFNGFWFGGRALLVPTSKWDFEPTLAALKLAQGIADYDLARRCEKLVALARKQKLSTDALEKVLTEIRLTADKTPPRYRLERLRTTEVAPARLQAWREALLREAGKLIAQLAPKGPA